MATQEELQAASDRVALLREQIADATSKRLADERTASSDLQLAQLEVEAKELEAQLDQATVVRVDATSPALSAQQQMEAALRQQQVLDEAAASRAASDQASADAQPSDTAEVTDRAVTDVISASPPPAVPAVTESASSTDSEGE